ncbi:MAG: amino acid-binding protein, partial [Propionibacteriaceae bacterium]|nr:amino acid-binding protein [Propionibacteriaceae bacterium]
MFLLRVQLPDTPGALGHVATAIGEIGANIRALQIIDEDADLAVDDFMVDLPSATLPDTLVAACQSVPGVRVLWVQRHHSDWSVATDLELLEHMESSHGRAAELLVEGAPLVFHS